jgi:hypothetical protein
MRWAPAPVPDGCTKRSSNAHLQYLMMQFGACGSGRRALGYVSDWISTESTSNV